MSAQWMSSGEIFTFAVYAVPADLVACKSIEAYTNDAVGLRI